MTSMRLLLHLAHAHKARRFVLAASLLTLSLQAFAQFNGPASLGGPEINRPVTLTSDPALLHPTASDYKLSPGDTVTLRVYGDTDYNPSVRVNLNGDIALPLIGLVHVQGLSIVAAQQLIADRLSSAGMFNNPQVLIQLTEGPSDIVTIIGEVHGVVPLVGQRRLLDVLATSGGLPPTASHVITIDRPGVPEPIVVDIGNDPLHIQAADIPVLAGDTIIVSRIGIVYVFGAFKSTGTIPLNSYSPLTLTELTALSGGTAYEGKHNDLRIIRTVGNQRTVSVVDIKKVINGKIPDPILQPNDIVYLAPSPIKAFFDSPAVGTVLGLVSLAITLATIR